MPWEEKSVMQERIIFALRAVKPGVDFSDLCQEFGVSRPTGYLWLKRSREVDNLFELGERSRRPKSSPNRTCPEHEDRVVKLRKLHGWGGKKLRGLLEGEGIKLTTVTINRIIKRQGLIKLEDSHPKAIRRFEREAPNQLWQMDFKGHYILVRGCCYPLSILDDHSRFLVGLFALDNQSTEAVFKCLLATFERYGLPESMLVDHGNPWWSNTNGWGLTRLMVKLIKQGILLRLSGVGHPQTQGKVERFHRTLKQAIKHRGMPGNFSSWPVLLGDIREEYNTIRPHEALDMEVPAKHYKASTREYNPNPPEWEYPSGSIIKRLNLKGHLSYKGRTYFVCEALSGELVRLELLGKRLLISYRHMYIREIDIETGKTMTILLPKI